MICLERVSNPCCCQLKRRDFATAFAIQRVLNCGVLRTVPLVGLFLTIANTGALLGDEIRYNRRSFLKEVSYEPVVREPTELELYPQGILELHLREKGDSIATLDLQIWGKVIDARVFNPHHRTLINESYNVAFFDEQQNHVGNLYPDINSGSFRDVTPGDWIKMPLEGGVCTRIVIKTRRLSRPWKADKIVLPPGKYEVQVVANSMLFAHPPVDLNGKFDEELAARWPQGTVNQDAWRSNRVTIEITSEHPNEP